MGNWREQRSADLLRIGAARRRLGLDDATWGALLHDLSGAHDARLEHLDARALSRLLAFLRSCGALRAEVPPPPAPCSRPAHVGQLRSMWGQLAASGVVADGSFEALERFVHHHTGVEGLGRLTAGQAAALVSELKTWRRGWRRGGGKSHGQKHGRG
ncbi:MAG: regulatory protein GemA [Nitrospirota bacterium]|nr:regulatory protein GemA [Nitrospirota bacterium]